MVTVIGHAGAYAASGDTSTSKLRSLHILINDRHLEELFNLTVLQICGEVSLLSPPTLSNFLVSPSHACN